MSKKQDVLVQEEQKELDNLIKDMDRAMIELNSQYTYASLQAKKAREKSLPDTYGMLVDAQNKKMTIKQRKEMLSQTRDELYHTRLILDGEDDKGRFRENIKVGLHSYISGGRVFVMDWRREVVRPYVLNDSITESENIVRGKNGAEYVTHFTLRMKRQVELNFDRVERVAHLFPQEEETEDIIADEFLNELLKRRSETEFRNIVFSIQKKQGEIIQAPFRQDMIVQGCAGSGKSMIMLHRLPIVLFDNPNSLDRNNLYIITPSLAYIQMADNMREDLEINDLKMGTLEQYYDYVLSKYDINPSVYGRIRSDGQLNYAQLKYVYSDQFVTDVIDSMNDAIKAGQVNLSKAAAIFGSRKGEAKRTTVNERIGEEILKIQYYRNLNGTALREYHARIRRAMDAIEGLSKLLLSRRQEILRTIEAGIFNAKEEAAELKEKLSQSTERRLRSQVMLQEKELREEEQRVRDYEDAAEVVKLDDEYFDRLVEGSHFLTRLSALFAGFQGNVNAMSMEALYQCMANKELFCDEGGNFLNEMKQVEDAYKDYAQPMEPAVNRVEKALRELSDFEKAYLPAELAAELETGYEYYNKLQKNLVYQVYLNVMKRLGQEPTSTGHLDALPCSPYMYLQIVFRFRGIHYHTKESLITIDEAQNIAPEELRLIKAVNNNRVILNLFGDIKQHIDHTKGVDSWQKFSDIADFKTSDLNENYRNARQITNYCNKTFNMNMMAINLDGAGVHFYNAEDEFARGLVNIFTKPMKQGLSAIIVKNASEAAWIKKQAQGFTSRLHDLTLEPKELLRYNWNLMTVNQVKGLEFETVIAVSGRMGQNEKYITYTRALDELYICEAPVSIEIEAPKVPIKEQVEENKAEPTVRRKRVKRSSAEGDTKALDNAAVSGKTSCDEKEEIDYSQIMKISEGVTMEEFFEAAGLEVIDMRKKGGALWVIGEKAEIQPIVLEAIARYGASGNYGSGKASGFRYGWFTKTKK